MSYYIPGSKEDIEFRKEYGQYPYWINEFNKEFKGYMMWFNNHKSRKINYDDTCNNYRVFMIFSDHFYDTHNRAQVVDMMKTSTRENPIEYQGEIFWAEKE